MMYHQNLDPSCQSGIVSDHLGKKRNSQSHTEQTKWVDVLRRIVVVGSTSHQLGMEQHEKALGHLQWSGPSPIRGWNKVRNFPTLNLCPLANCLKLKVDP